MADASPIEHFHGVYLLYCLNPKYTGRTYIGYTVDPNRRIKQHNKGKKFGGAWKTSNKGPWTMVMIIHGFSNDISALRFEWAWQHPQSSRRLQHVSKKKPREKVFDFCLRVLSEMLQVGPWNRLPLTIRWLNEELTRDFPIGKSPPMHMPICCGQVISKKLKYQNSEVLTRNCPLCFVCSKFISTKAMSCLNGSCVAKFHVVCLSQYFLTDGEYIPVEGQCPKCKDQYLWGEIVRKYKGCYADMDVQINVEAADDFYASEGDCD